MTVSIETREEELGEVVLGPVLHSGVFFRSTSIDDHGEPHVTRRRYYWNGVLEDLDGDNCFFYAEATVAGKIVQQEPDVVPPPPPDPVLPPTDLRAAILVAAASRIGLPYRLNPPPDGINNIDCSLYVLKTYADVGLPFVHVRTAEQIRKVCEPIDWPDILPGDLLFFEKTYDAGGERATHIGMSLGAGSGQMWDAHGTGVQLTDITTDYWQEHLFEARRHPDLIDTGPAERVYTLAELQPMFEGFGATSKFSPQVLAAIAYQESSFKNYRVHRDGTGHGLFGLDDNGLLPSFERWSGMSVGRGATAQIMPVDLQISYAAETLGRLTHEKYGGDPLTAAQEWHRGAARYDDAAGLNYRRLIEAHVARLFP